MNASSAVFQILDNALTTANLRQQVDANNIANASTPGYKAQSVQFESMLQQAMSGAVPAVAGEPYIPISTSATNWQALAQIQPVVSEDTSVSTSNNGNSVNMDAQMANLAENQIEYNALVQDLATRFQRLQQAIGG